MTDSKNSHSNQQTEEFVDPFSMDLSQQDDDAGTLEQHTFLDQSTKTVQKQPLSPVFKKKLYLGLGGLATIVAFSFLSLYFYKSHPLQQLKETTEMQLVKAKMLLNAFNDPAPQPVEDKADKKVPLLSPLSIKEPHKTEMNFDLPTEQKKSSTLEKAFEAVDQNRLVDLEELRKNMLKETDTSIKSSTSTLQTQIDTAQQQAEQLNNANQAIRSQMSQLINAINAINQQVNQNKEQIARLENSFNLISRNLSKLSMDLNSLDSRMLSLTNNINTLSSDVNLVKRDLRTEDFDALTLPTLNKNNPGPNQALNHPKRSNINPAALEEGPEYIVHAIVPGRVWLKSIEGQILSLTEGESLGDYGKIVMIDANNQIVLTSSGVTFR